MKLMVSAALFLLVAPNVSAAPILFDRVSGLTIEQDRGVTGLRDAVFSQLQDATFSQASGYDREGLINLYVALSETTPTDVGSYTNLQRSLSVQRPQPHGAGLLARPFDDRGGSDISSVPEPATLLTIAVGLLVLARVRRRFSAG